MLNVEIWSGGVLLYKGQLLEVGSFGAIVINTDSGFLHCENINSIKVIPDIHFVRKNSNE